MRQYTVLFSLVLVRSRISSSLFYAIENELLKVKKNLKSIFAFNDSNKLKHIAFYAKFSIMS